MYCNDWIWANRIGSRIIWGIFDDNFYACVGSESRAHQYLITTSDLKQITLINENTMCRITRANSPGYSSSSKWHSTMVSNSEQEDLIWVRWEPQTLSQCIDDVDRIGYILINFLAAHRRGVTAPECSESLTTGQQSAACSSHGL